MASLLHGLSCPQGCSLRSLHKHLPNRWPEADTHLRRHCGCRRSDAVIWRIQSPAPRHHPCEKQLQRSNRVASRRHRAHADDPQDLCRTAPATRHRTRSICNSRQYFLVHGASTPDGRQLWNRWNGRCLQCGTGTVGKASGRSPVVAERNCRLSSQAGPALGFGTIGSVNSAASPSTHSSFESPLFVALASTHAMSRPKADLQRVLAIIDRQHDDSAGVWRPVGAQFERGTADSK